MKTTSPRFRVLLWVFGGVLIALLLVSLVTTRWHKGATAQFCEQCGIRLWITSDHPVESNPQSSEERSLEDTDLSRWFKAHISPDCEHKWRFNHSTSYVYLSIAGRQVWKISGVAGSYPTPPIILQFDREKAQVESLYRESPEKCTSYIRSRLQWKTDVTE